MSRIKAIVSFLLLFTFASVASANITYNVNRTIGGGSVSGFIVTNGALGTLSNANLVDWQLTLSSPNLQAGPTSFIQMSNPLGTAIGIFGSAVSATATDLYFDFGSGNNNYLVFYSQNNAATSTDFWCLVAGPISCLGEATPGESIGFNAQNSFAEYEFRGQAGNVSIASVTAVPEPETYAMMLAGLRLLGFAARRRKQAAVA